MVRHFSRLTPFVLYLPWAIPSTTKLNRNVNTLFRPWSGRNVYQNPTNIAWVLAGHQYCLGLGLAFHNEHNIHLQARYVPKLVSSRGVSVASHSKWPSHHDNTCTCAVSRKQCGPMVNHRAGEYSQGVALFCYHGKPQSWRMFPGRRPILLPW